MDDLDQAHEYLGEVEEQFFHLSSLAVIPLRNRQRFPLILSALDQLDRGLFRVAPTIRRRAWMTVLPLADPLAQSGPGTPAA